MRNLMISLAAAASALTLAGPASAQWYPQPYPQPYAQPYGQPYYGQPYGNAYGYQNNYGQVRQMQAQVNTIQRRIRQLDRMNAISRGEARSLRAQSNQVEQRLRVAARNGLNPWERSELTQRIANLSWRLRAEANDGRRWQNQGRYVDGRVRYDRDRDGRDDRYEDDRGTRHD